MLTQEVKGVRVAQMIEEGKLEQYMQNLMFFNDAVDLDDDITILGMGCHDKDDVEVVSMSYKHKDGVVEDVHVALSELLEKCNSVKDGKWILKVLKDEDVISFDIDGDKSVDGGKQVLHGISRVVGYFSRTDNWNKSKMGELKDRQKGNYSTKGYKESADVGLGSTRSIVGVIDSTNDCVDGSCEI